MPLILPSALLNPICAVSNFVWQIVLSAVVVACQSAVLYSPYYGAAAAPYPYAAAPYPYAAAYPTLAKSTITYKTSGNT